MATRPLTAAQRRKHQRLVELANPQAGATYQGKPPKRWVQTPKPERWKPKG